MLRLATHAMGTRFELVVADIGGDERRLRAIGEEVLESIELCDRRFSRFRSDSWLAHLERTAPRETVRLDDDDFELFDACDRVHRESLGAFDVTVAPLMDSLDALSVRGGPGNLGAARERVGWSSVELDRRARTIRFTRDGVKLDLGGIAKGHALDLAARVLREKGVENALVHGGTSSVIALGAPPDRAAWRVELEGGEGAATVELANRALSVSAQHGRLLANGGGHVLDPRSKRQSESLELVAVLHESARVAEAWSTALLVLGDIPPAARELDVAIGRGERFARTWRFHREPNTNFRVASTPLELEAT